MGEDEDGGFVVFGSSEEQEYPLLYDIIGLIFLINKYF